MQASTAMVPRQRYTGGSCNRKEQCVNASSYPEGQFVTPSHHTDAFMHAFNSGHRNGHSSGRIRPIADKISFLKQTMHLLIYF